MTNGGSIEGDSKLPNPRGRSMKPEGNRRGDFAEIIIREGSNI
jgi:hypothetical protein